MELYLWEGGRLIAQDSSSGGTYAKLRPLATNWDSTYIIEVFY